MIASPDRPLVTFALFAYNQEQYIREAVEGAFAQTYQPLEIILSDDCSVDQTFEIMKEMVASYSGPHKIVLRRSSTNRGLSSHFNEVMEASSGDIIILAAGDDISLPERSRLSVQILEEHSDVVSLCSSAFIIDADGRRTGTKNIVPARLPYLKFSLAELSRARTLGASRAFRRQVFENFGALNTNCPTEDTPLLLRSLLTGNVLNLSEPMVLYRVHETNLSGRQSVQKISADHIEDQYKSDLDVLSSIGALSDGASKICSKWMRENRNINFIRRNTSSNVPVPLLDLVKFVCVPRVGLREKLGIGCRHLLQLARFPLGRKS
jgi:glycosyltransferase involved in cell wall biosynthesis